MSLVISDESPLYKMADYNYTKRKIDEEEDVSNSEMNKTSLASLVQKKLAANKIDDLLELLNAIFSFMLALTFAIETYYHDPYSYIIGENMVPVWMEVCDTILMALLIADYLVFFYIHHESRILYVFSFDSFITFVSIVPTALVRGGVITDIAIINTYYLNFWRVIRLFSCLRCSKVFARRNMTIARVYFRLIFYILLIIFVFASAMLTIENMAAVDAVKETYSECLMQEDDEC